MVIGAHGLRLLGDWKTDANYQATSGMQVLLLCKVIKLYRLHF